MTGRKKKVWTGWVIFHSDSLFFNGQINRSLRIIFRTKKDATRHSILPTGSKKIKKVKVTL